MADKEQPKAPQVPAPPPPSGGMTDAEARRIRDEKRMEDAQKKKFNEGPKLGYKKGGKVSSASSRADGIASRGKTRGTIVRMG